MADEIETIEPGTRRLARELAQTAADQADRHALTLESILAVLRSPRMADNAARVEATEIASTALVELRTSTDRQRGSLLEPVAKAFSRLRADLRPLTRFGTLDVEFVEPPATGRALPGDVAQTARAIVRTSVLVLVDAGTANRVRVQWDCDGRNLLMEVRDNGDGGVSVHDDAMRPIAEHVAAFDGTLEMSSTPGWGSVMHVSIPLDEPAFAQDIGNAENLTNRERDVLRLVATGIGNQEIADGLGISLNTVKYHVGNLLRKFGARSRSELAATVR